MSDSQQARALREAAINGPGEEKIRLAQMKPKEQIAYLLEKKKGEIAKVLPRHLTADRLLKVAQIAATTTPALAKCDVASLVGAIAQCAQMGLEPNTVLGHAYLVPFNTKRKDADGNERWVNSVQVIIGYKGLIDLARRSGQIVSIAAHEVCEKDEFRLSYGIDEELKHVPSLGERGAVIGFYAVAKLVGGGYAFEWMSRVQVEKVRDESQGWQQAVKFKKQGAHPWSVHFVEMGRKTVIRRLAKYLPLSIEFQTAVAMDEAGSTGRDQHLDDALEGEFMPEISSGADGVEPESDDGEEERPALSDDRDEQESRSVRPTVGAQQAEEVSQEAPRRRPQAKAAEAQQTEQAAAKPPSLWDQFGKKIAQATGAADQETAFLLLDEARSMLGEMHVEHQKTAGEMIAEAAEFIKEKGAGK